MHIAWDQASQSEWTRMASDGGAALQQDWAYGEAMTQLGGRALRAVAFDGDTPIAIAQFLVREFAGVARAALLSNGPVWLADIDDATKAAVYRALRKTCPLARPRLMLMTPIDADPGRSLKLAKLKRVMTGLSTASVDLRDDLDVLRAKMRQKWRNRLNAAERSDLRIVETGGKPSQYRWLLNQEDAQRKAKRYKAPPVEFAEAFHAAKGGKSGVHVLRADLGRDQTAAMMFLTHGRRATYHIGWSSEAGRNAAAHNLILWQAMNTLKEAGIDTLDLGGVDTVAGAGVARFKLGAGGTLSTLPGTFV